MARPVALYCFNFDFAFEFGAECLVPGGKILKFDFRAKRQVHLTRFEKKRATPCTSMKHHIDSPSCYETLWCWE